VTGEWARCNGAGAAIVEMNLEKRAEMLVF